MNRANANYKKIDINLGTYKFSKQITVLSNFTTEQLLDLKIYDFYKMNNEGYIAYGDRTSHHQHNAKAGDVIVDASVYHDELSQIKINYPIAIDWPHTTTLRGKVFEINEIVSFNKARLNDKPIPSHLQHLPIV